MGKLTNILTYDLSKLFKKEEKKEKRKESKADSLQRAIAITKHENRINNLDEELITLSSKLKENEGNFEIPKSAREKTSDTIIRRMTIIRYEIEIREGLIEWLS